MKWILGFVIFCGSMAWGEGFRKDFTKQIYVVGVGQVKLKYEFSGEPVSRPRSLEIWVKCEQSKAWEPVGQFLMCVLGKYEYDAKTKKLHVKYTDGRVNPKTGESICDVAGDDHVDLGKLCKD